MALQDTFLRSDQDEKGYLDEATAIKTAQDLERKPYDEVRATLKQVELDSSRRVELDDFVDVCCYPQSGFCVVRRLTDSFLDSSSRN